MKKATLAALVILLLNGCYVALDGRRTIFPLKVITHNQRVIMEEIRLEGEKTRRSVQEARQ